MSRSPQQITERLDTLIADLRKQFHAHAIGKPKGSVKEPFDVLIVAHGHILRAFAGRWVDKDIANNPSLILEAGGVGTMSYEHHKMDEPAILLGGAFVRIPTGNMVTRTTSLPHDSHFDRVNLVAHARSRLRHLLTLLPVTFR